MILYLQGRSASTDFINSNIKGNYMATAFLGVDISKLTFDVALLNDKEIINRKFSNNPKGFLALKHWLIKEGIVSAHACMEATGCYGEKLAEYFYNADFKVSVINPAQIRGFGRSELARVKTDKADAALIARFCRAVQPPLWKPTEPHIKELQSLISRLNALIAMKLEENNRLEKDLESVSPAAKSDISKHLYFLNERIKEMEDLIQDKIKANKDLQDKHDLLISIPGLGEKTVAIILAFLPTIENFESAKQVSAFVGLNPKLRQSGSSVRGAGHISKTGNSDLRKAFYMPSLVAMKHNSTIKKFCDNLAKKGKIKMVIVCAAMRKLLHIVYGVLKNKTAFNGSI